MTDRELMQQALEVLERCPALYRAPEAATALRERLAQPEQEPVAWIVPDFGFLFPTEDAAKRYLRNVESDAQPTPLYPHPAAPVQRKPLTLQQIRKLWSDAHNDTTDRMAFEVLARLIEAAHGIKGDA